MVVGLHDHVASTLKIDGHALVPYQSHRLPIHPLPQGVGRTATIDEVVDQQETRRSQEEAQWGNKAEEAIGTEY